MVRSTTSGRLVTEKAQRGQGDVLAFKAGAGWQVSRVDASTLATDVLLFRVPVELVKILNRDLMLAGIPKLAERGRVLDVHCLRGTFATLLSKGGVPLRTAQAAMRHSDPKLTANVYCDPFVLDVHSALDSLPMLPLDSSSTTNTQTMQATGTDDLRASNSSPSAVAVTVPVLIDFSRNFFRGICSQRLALWPHFQQKPTSPTRSMQLLLVTTKNARCHCLTASVWKLPGEDLNLD